jgi:hypothetical protein
MLRPLHLRRIAPGAAIGAGQPKAAEPRILKHLNERVLIVVGQHARGMLT